MIITKKAIDYIEKTETKFNKLVAVTALFIVVSIITTLLSMSNAFEANMTGEETICAYISLGCLILLLGTLCAIMTVRDKLMLDAINLKRGQTLYEVNYACLDVIPVTVNNIDTGDRNRFISVDETCSHPMHENLYYEKESAENALNRFLEELYKDVSNCVGYDGTVSAIDRANFREGYMNYLSAKRPANPIDYDITEVVKAIVKYCKSKEYRKTEYDEAVTALKNHLITRK